MILFACDLDNTLFYRDPKVNRPTICVTQNENHSNWFISLTSYELLSKLQNLLTFVPVTTRSLHRYQDIQLFDASPPRYALIDNGTCLLTRGEIDHDWALETQRLAEETQPSLTAALRVLSADPNRQTNVYKLSTFLYGIQSKKPLKSIRYLLNNIDRTQIALQQQKQFLYLFPKTLNKGAGVQRLIKQLNDPYVVAAGDGLFDVPMLRCSDSCYVPNKHFRDAYLEGVHPHVFYQHPNDSRLFSDMLLSSILQRIQEGDLSPIASS